MHIPRTRTGAPGVILPSNVEEASPEPQASSVKQQAASAKKDLTVKHEYGIR